MTKKICDKCKKEDAILAIRVSKCENLNTSPQVYLMVDFDYCEECAKQDLQDYHIRYVK